MTPAPGNERLRVGSLQYTLPKLVEVFIWLLLGSFGYFLIASAVPLLLPLTLREMRAGNTAIGIIVGSIPAAMNLMVNPIISFRSDRTRTRWGRRRPYLLVAAPLIAALLVLIGWSRQLLEFCPVPAAYFPVLALAVLGALVVLYQFFYLFVASTIYYLFVDVVPGHYLGRYMAFFNLVSALNGFIFTRWLVGYAEDAASWLYTGAAIFFLICMLVMVAMVKEGSYPPVTDVGARTTLREKIVIYARECFSIPFYLWLFLAMAINGSSTICRALFGIFFARESMGLTVEQFGHVSSYGFLVSITLALPLGWLNDRIHPLKIFTFGALLVIVVNGLSFFLIRDYNSYFFFGMATALAYAVQGSSSLPMSAALFPKSHYGQFGSAQAMFCSVILILANGVGGYFMDMLGDYRYLFVWDFVLTLVAVAALGVVFRLWRQYGGEKNYVAPTVELPHP